MTNASKQSAHNGDFFLYWGKARAAINSGPTFHLLAYHCLDVAAVAEVWWRESRVIRHALSKGAGADGSTLAWAKFFVALHDLGKFDVRFQLKAREAFQALRSGFDVNLVSLRDSEGYFHGPAGYAWFTRQYPAIVGMQERNRVHLESWQGWLAAVTGHHGVIPQHAHMLNLDGRFADPSVKAFDWQARAAWLKKLEALFLVPNGLTLRGAPPPVSPLFAGFCAVCDWLGSNADPGFFEYNDRPSDLASYYESRLPVAEKALALAGLYRHPLTEGGFEKLFSFAARQAQTLVPQLPVAPSLTLIEAPTGSGKTEAALAYASQLLAAGLAESVIFALPTQATANAMLDRLERIAAILFPDAANVILAHGKARYNQNIKALKARAKMRTVQGKEAASVHCAEWLAQSRKRVFLGQIGVCTVDQVLLSVLPVKHAFVRTLGLGKSVLIVDEVHAYDAYMYGLLGEVLKQQRESGGSVLLLSATLPYHQREALLASWGAGEAAVRNASYPLVSWASFDGECRTLELPEDETPPRRTVAIELRTSADLLPEAVLEDEIVASAHSGAKVAVICNLVADAQQLARRLRQRANVPVDIFHSRYRFIDRQDKDLEALKHYGKERAPGGRILVATQVVEQSLDLDFDWMITQVCPMDLLFQRLGRLHRHERSRPRGFEIPRCTVFVPPADQFGDCENFYCKGILWRTRALLQGRSELVFPDAYRPLIEHVYEREPWLDLGEPKVIRQSLNDFVEEAEGVRIAAVQLARTPMNPFDAEEKLAAFTRGGEMNLNVLPLSEDAASPLDAPDIVLAELEDWERAEVVNLHSVPVPASWRGDLPTPEDFVIMLPMRQVDTGTWQGEADKARYTYSLDFGLTKEKR
jgi:CRISPR-associated endonuclease/helicase Cas3